MLSARRRRQLAPPLAGAGDQRVAVVAEAPLSRLVEDHPLAVLAAERERMMPEPKKTKKKQRTK